VTKKATKDRKGDKVKPVHERVHLVCLAIKGKKGDQDVGHEQEEFS
jgi:hypothetical protein